MSRPGQWQATHAVDVLVRNDFDGATSIKIKVGVVNNSTKSSTMKLVIIMKPPNGYNIDSSHSNSYLGEAECNASSKHYHESHDMSSSCRPPSNCGRQSHSRRSDSCDGKYESSREEKEVITFILFLHNFMVGMSLLIIVTLVGSLLKIMLVIVNL